MKRFVVCLAILGLAGIPFPLHAEPEESETERVEPARVTVQHILLGFRASVPKKWVERSKKESEVLARELLQRARAGEDFAGLVKEFTNDRFPGLYTLVNRGEEPGPGEFKRGAMVKGFGDVAFNLEVGEIGMAAYHPTKSPYGWHIIQRVE